jgi:acyl transferase domain-containing protein/acyl carrier protein
MNGNYGLENSQLTGVEIAIIGMAARFPGAKNLDEFWNNLVGGIESISFFNLEELLECGLTSGDLDHPDYVAAKAFLEDVEYFDAVFFGYSPREAEIMAPQTRIALECVWEALEDAAYNPDTYDSAIGAFIGASHGICWEALSFTSGKSRNFGEFTTILLNDKDFVSTYISYKLNLKGPSFTLFTSCSTSGVAIHQACQSLLSGDCQMVVAGGVSVWVPRKRGYVYQEGMIFSKDGHCRPFDADSSGTVFGDGIGMVVLKPLEDAAADRDHIYAVIKGTAINNDGNRKVGFTAPSTEGQAAVIRAAYHVAGVSPETISYIEAHGTGTPIGDPIEVEALKLAFNTNKTGFCKIGSVKGNVGHLDTAAGLAGFIKTTLAIKHQLIPPTLHFKINNPKIDFENSPFRVNTELTEWDRWKNGDYPLRAGISFFGVGGTNVHAVLEERPKAKSADYKTQNQEHLEQRQAENHLILLSAKTGSALDKATENLAQFLKVNPGINLADAAYTLQLGRKPFKHRRMVACTHTEEAAEQLQSIGPAVSTYTVPEEAISLIFMFPGQGSQYLNMGIDLYRNEPVFRDEMNHCFEILKSSLGYDIKEILYPRISVGKVSKVSEMSKECRSLDNRSHRPHTSYDSNKSYNPDILSIDRTETAQPLLFIFEYALAKLLIHWGIIPQAMIGHSIGEYTAACLSGVFSLEDALKLVIKRGKLMQQMPSGDMLGVQLSKEELTPLLSDELALAAVNAPSTCVVSGSPEAVKVFKEQLEKKAIKTRPLHTSHAFHSPMMDSILEEFAGEVKKASLHRPQIPYISNTTGTWITDNQAIEPEYWSNHLRKTIKFAAGVKELLKQENRVFVEVGPGNVLGVLVRKIQGSETSTIQPVVSLVRHPRENVSDSRYLLDKLGRLWLVGKTIDWEAFYSGKTRYRIPLPKYPFERQYFWIDGNPFNMTAGIESNRLALDKKSNIGDWFYKPLWKRSRVNRTAEVFVRVGDVLLFIEECGLGNKLKMQLEKQGFQVSTVRPGKEFTRLAEREYSLNPLEISDYDTLFNELDTLGELPSSILHLWSITLPGLGSPLHHNQGIEKSEVEKELDRGFYSLLTLAQALGKKDSHQHFQLKVVSNNVQDVVGGEVKFPGKATLLGPVNVIEREFNNISCCMIDLVLPESGSPQEQELVDRLITELKIRIQDSAKIIAFRNGYRWVQDFEAVEMEKSPDRTVGLSEKGVYLVTGGLGGMGLVLAEHLAKSVKARLILTGRSPFPAQQEWDDWLSNHEVEDKISRRIRKLQELEALGAEVMVFSADVTDYDRMKEVITWVENQYGTLNGVIHAAGIPDGAMIPLRNREMSEGVLAPKVTGTLVLDRLLQDYPLDFFVLCSSTASILSLPGQIAYASANAFLDAYAARRRFSSGTTPTAIDWDMWKGTGIAVIAEQEYRNLMGEDIFNGITPAEGVEIFSRILADPMNRVIVSPSDLKLRLKQLNAFDMSSLTNTHPVEKKKGRKSPQQRPMLGVTYVEPTNEIEKAVAETWQDYLGIDNVGIYDNFFDLGATSLDIIQVNHKLNNLWETKIPLVKMLTYTTVNSFANYFVQEMTDMDSGAQAKKTNPSHQARIQKGKKSLQQKFIKKRMASAN